MFDHNCCNRSMTLSEDRSWEYDEAEALDLQEYEPYNVDIWLQITSYDYAHNKTSVYIFI